jgi:sulfite reductase beta subunit-like hemoprotein
MSDKCESCGVAWADHLGIMGTCRKLGLVSALATTRGMRLQEMEAKLKQAQARIKRLKNMLAKEREWGEAMEMKGIKR